MTLCDSPLLPSRRNYTASWLGALNIHIPWAESYSVGPPPAHLTEGDGTPASVLLYLC